MYLCIICIVYYLYWFKRWIIYLSYLFFRKKTSRLQSRKFFYCVTPMSWKREETMCPVPKENHANASGSASWTEHLQYLRRRKLKSNDTTSVVVSGTGTPDKLWATVFFGRLNRPMLCHCFSELWSFFPFSSETLHWRCRYTIVITHNYTESVSFCVSWMDHKSIYSFFSPLSLSMVLTQLNRWCGVHDYLIW